MTFVKNAYHFHRVFKVLNAIILVKTNHIVRNKIIRPNDTHRYVLMLCDFIIKQNPTCYITLTITNHSHLSSPKSYDETLVLYFSI